MLGGLDRHDRSLGHAAALSLISQAVDLTHPMSDTPIAITHDEAQGRFQADVDGHLCVLDYQLRGNTMIIQHTGVPGAIGGRGIAAALTRHALDTARKRGWLVLPVCSYAAAYIARHPDYQDLVA
ncbi:hypothetical protein BOTU111922_05665 [Bordetella tumulicola]